MQGGTARKFTLFFSNDQFISLFFSFLSVVSANFSKRALSAARPGVGFRSNRAAARKEHNPQTLPIAGPQPVALAMPRMPPAGTESGPIASPREARHKTNNVSTHLSLTYVRTNPLLTIRGTPRPAFCAAAAPSPLSRLAAGGNPYPNAALLKKFRRQEVTACGGTFPDFATSLHEPDTRIGSDLSETDDPRSAVRDTEPANHEPALSQGSTPSRSDPPPPKGRGKPAVRRCDCGYRSFAGSGIPPPANVATSLPW